MPIPVSTWNQGRTVTHPYVRTVRAMGEQPHRRSCGPRIVDLKNPRKITSESR
ncbi:hypothetical protein J6590_001116 [Homalodisca vitripennis]|nr:hypothetical protein J6590_001116 [Homalodisca vitripennis]